MAFLTPQEDFNLFLEEENYNYRYTQYLENEMHKHEATAVLAISRDLKDKFSAHAYACCVASAFIEGLKDAESIFDNHGLKEIHAWALQGHMKNFEEEFEKLNERSYD